MPDATTTILVTGVSSGIGHALASAWLDRGATVLGTSRRTPEDLVARGLRFAAADAMEPAALEAALEVLFDGIDSLDLAVLNAGRLGEIRDMVDSPLDDMRRTMDVNVWSYKTVIDWLLRASKPTQIVTISSGAAVNGSRGWNGYSISKAALNMLTLLYARERADVHFTALAPGLVDTAMQDQLCGMDHDERFAVLAKLRGARGTSTMPIPTDAAPMLIAAMEAAMAHPSGTFLDVRDMNLT